MGTPNTTSTNSGDSSDFGPLGQRVEAFDQTVDALFEPLRSNSFTNRTMYRASTAGDWSAIWHVCGIASALVRRRPRDAVRLSIVMGFESLLVNQGIKRLFGRGRPRRDDIAHDHHIRQPVTSSFPSGHASAAMTAAAVLSRNGKRPLWYSLAMVVATSRIHVKMHHPSDVAAGLVTGAVLGRIANSILDRVDE